jgi:ABC-type transport system involved in multi-copper enzyme maturation permease subunit
VLISVYLALLLLVSVFFYHSITERLNLGAPLVNAQIGQAMFTALALSLQTLTVFIAPALTVNAISSEYESYAIEMLAVTPLSPMQILLGKLGSALAFLTLLLFATLPLFSMVALFGGVTLADLGYVLLTALISGATGCVLGLFCSAITRQTYTATVLCYALLVSVVGGSMFAANLWSMLHSLSSAPPGYVVLNPLTAVAAVLSRTSPPDFVTPGTLSPMALLSLLTNGTIVQVAGEQFVLPIYRATWIVYGGLMLFLLWISAHAVQRRQPLHLYPFDGVFLVLVLGYTALLWVTVGWWLPGLGV